MSDGKSKVPQVGNGAAGFDARQQYGSPASTNSTGFAAVTSYPVHQVHLPAKQASPGVLSEADSPIQRKVILEEFGRTEKEQELRGAVGILGGNATEWMKFAESKHIDLFISIEDGEGPNPAYITNPIKNSNRSGHWVYILKIKRWFIEAHPVGKIIGVLNHEIGVHALPYLEKVKANIQAELDGDEQVYQEEELTAQERGGLDDHRRAMTEGSREFDIYFKTALNSANVFDAAGAEAQEAGQAAIDVMFSYLMDLAAMAEDGDKGKLAMKGMIPNLWQKETFAYILARYNKYVGLLPEEWRAKIPAMSEKDIEKAFLDFRAAIPKKKVTLSALGLLILVCIIYLYAKGLPGGKPV